MSEVSEDREMVIRKLLLLSSSAVHGHEFLQYAKSDITEFLSRHSVKKILFIPYALPDQDSYYGKVKKIYNDWGFEIDSIHKSSNPVKSVQTAEAFFIGGGNTFLLLKTLYEKRLVDAIRERVIKNGVPYIGTSAGTNVATATINTTNDMPIVLPPTFEALKLVPFNINPHYLDVDKFSKHKGESREERLMQYLQVDGQRPILAMREGVHLLVENGTATLKGINKSRLFIKGKETQELDSGSDVTFLMKLQ